MLLATSFPNRTGRILALACAESLNTSELHGKCPNAKAQTVICFVRDRACIP
jgi:hypothetical protein